MTDTPTLSARNYKITPLMNGTIEVRIGEPLPGHPSAIVLRFPLAEALTFGLDVASAARHAATRYRETP